MTAQKRFAWRSRNIEAVNYADVAEMQYGNDLEENILNIVVKIMFRLKYFLNDN